MLEDNEKLLRSELCTVLFPSWSSVLLDWFGELGDLAENNS